MIKEFTLFLGFILGVVGHNQIELSNDRSVSRNVNGIQLDTDSYVGKFINLLTGNYNNYELTNQEIFILVMIPIAIITGYSLAIDTNQNSYKLTINAIFRSIFIIVMLIITGCCLTIGKNQISNQNSYELTTQEIFRSIFIIVMTHTVIITGYCLGIVINRIPIQNSYFSPNFPFYSRFHLHN